MYWGFIFNQGLHFTCNSIKISFLSYGIIFTETDQHALEFQTLCPRFLLQCIPVVYVFVYIYLFCNLYTNTVLHISLPDLERAWVGCAIASAGIQIFAILTMICGLWPADCANAKRSTLYLVTSILCLIAGNHGYKNLHMVSHQRSVKESAGARQKFVS